MELRSEAKALLCNSWQRHCRDLMCLAKTKNSLASRRHGMLCLQWQGIDARLMETQRQGKDKRREGCARRGVAGTATAKQSKDWQRRSNARFALTGKGRGEHRSAQQRQCKAQQCVAAEGLRRAQRRKGYAANRKALLGKEDYLRRMRK